MQRRAKKAVTAVAVVFLVVNAFLAFRWPEDLSYDPTEVSRRLAGRARAHTPKERVINEIIKQGIRPGDPKYRRLIRARLGRLAHRNEKAQSQRKTMMTLRKSKNIWFRSDKAQQAELNEKHAKLRELHLNTHAQKRMLNLNNSELDLEDLEPLSVCGRPTMIGTPSDLALLKEYNEENTCPGANSNKLLLLQDLGSNRGLYGRLGNNLIELLHAMQYARDNDVQLGIMSGSWAFGVLLKMWMSIEDNDWEAQFEKAFCVKIFNSQEEVQDYDLIFPTLTNTLDFTKQLFSYMSQRSLESYVGDQTKYLQTLYQNYNTGSGITESGEPVRDMCSGIKALFGNEKNVIYSAIHQRTLEEAGKQLLGRVSQFSGCDPEAALHMAPDYVKSILKPLGLLDYPIVLITDGQDFTVLQRLLNDPEIGPKLRLVPEEDTWVGGDITLAVMSNVFIGNPASTFSGFIAKSRLALGFGHSYLFRAKDENGDWHTVCGDTCIFDKNVMKSMA